MRSAWRHARRGADGLLRAAKADVNALAVHVERDAGKRGDGVHNKKRAELVGNFPEIVEAVHDARGGFAMSKADNLDLPALAGASNIFRVHGAAVGGFDARNLRRSALCNGGHALGEDAIDT